MENMHSEDSIGYENKDLDGRGIVLSTAVILIMLIGIVFLLRPLFKIDLMKHVLTTNSATITQNFSSPLLQPFPRVDWESFQTWEEDQLDSYGWVDPQKGVVRIPIQEAMNIFLQYQVAQPTKAEKKRRVPAP